jgi:hypothetical protein
LIVKSPLPLILGLALVAGCSDSPVSPTALDGGAGVTEPSRPLTLRWDLVAPNCSPRTPPSPLPEAISARVNHEPDGSIQASWDYTFPEGGTGLLYARFVRSGNEWALCFWDTASV